MQKLILLAISFFYIQPAFAMDFSEARNLLSKTSFGIVPSEINNLIPLTYSEGVDKLLNESTNVAKNKAPEWANQLPLNIDKKELSEEQKVELRKTLNNQNKELKTWWYKEMMITNSPITEHLTLFWHNHFTSSSDRVRKPLLMYNQNLLLRKYALGNFRDLLHNISKDPAMILYLDNQSNRKGKPNENFAREVMELFTLGEGNYTENDIKEAARAFTGWRVDKDSGQFEFNDKLHDKGIKYFFGKSGNFDGDQVLDIILEQPNVAIYITQKMWKEFISPNPDQDEVARIANIFRQSYEIKTLLRELLNSKYFRQKDNYANMAKSPVELIVGTMREFNIPIEDNDKNIDQIVKYGARLGQNIFEPPNVKGWVGGDSWITSSTLPARQQLLQRMTRGNEIFAKNYQSSHLSNLPSGKIELLWTDSPNSIDDINKIKQIIFPLEPIKPLTEKMNKMNYVRNAVLDPVYELK